MKVNWGVEHTIFSINEWEQLASNKGGLYIHTNTKLGLYQTTLATGVMNDDAVMTI